MLARIQRGKKGTWHIKSILPHIIHSDKELDERTPTIPPKRDVSWSLLTHRPVVSGGEVLGADGGAGATGG